MCLTLPLRRKGCFSREEASQRLLELYNYGLGPGGNTAIVKPSPQHKIALTHAHLLKLIMLRGKKIQQRKTLSVIEFSPPTGYCAGETACATCL